MDVEALIAEGVARIESAPDSAALEQARVALLGRKAPLVLALRDVGSLPAEERGPQGKRLNEARGRLESALEERTATLARSELDEQLRRDRVDVTLPGTAFPRGHRHLLEQTRRDVVEVFLGLGYQVAEGPEIETVYHNFDALNHLPTHPSRAETDTFYVADDLVLRTHTSPMQVRVMEVQQPPVYVVVPGRTFRRDTWDPTHGAVFTQIEGLAVDRGLTLAHLKGTLLAFARAIFGPEREVRLRPHFFPFTEPSIEADVSCFACARDGSPCRVCHGEGWIEMLGAGMVDPNVFGFVGYDAEEFTGFAFGMGVERIAMLKHAVPDLRLFWENDLRFLEQFGVKVPVSWLREYVSFDIPVPELAERLSLTGTKVEAIHARGVSEGLDRYLIGRVLSRDKHPDADRLSVCLVDVGEGEPRQIVCGATNFEAGATVAVVLPGGRLPDGTKLERAKLRGVVSDGMMLSERELELSQEHLGIMLLDGGLQPGEPLIDHLPIADTVIEFEITPNRPDCMNVYGIAREVSAVLDVELAPWPGVEPEALGQGTVDDYVQVKVEAPDLCPRWAGRVFTGVKVGPSPAWLKARIAAAGMRPISNVVDITNYVMLGIGEPTHAFDLDRVEGRQIIVRRAAPGERVVTLDGQERVLDPDVLVIGDAVKPSAIGGLMGAEWSEVHEGTATVLLEAANFDGPNAQRSSARLGLRTEGSARWERGLDPHLVPHAHRLAAQMLVELAGAQLVPGIADVSAELPERPVVNLRPQRLEQVIGVAYSDEEIERVLTRLGYEAAAEGWAVPTWRADTPREIDLVEEVARVAGLERLPAELPPHADAIGRLTRPQVLRDRVVEILLGTGLSEAATIPFTDPAVIERLRLEPGDPRADAIEVRNPMGRDQSRMRTLVFPSLLAGLRRNLAGGRSSAGLFEVARVYVNGEGLPDQPQHLAAVAAGEGAGFAAMRGRLDTLLATLRVELAVEAAAERFLHPGRAARIGELGLIGELHPEVAAAFDLDGPVAVLELDLDALIERVPGPAQYRDVISFPPVRQDIAVIVDAERPAAEVLAVVREGGGVLLAAASVFDVYEGPQVGEGRKSLAVHLAFQAADRTLTDAEADAVREQITAALAARLGAELRS